MNASSREEVFAQLRAKGIKAIKVVAADGSKANGEIRGVRKRFVVAWVIVAIGLTGAGVYFLSPRNSHPAYIQTTLQSPSPTRVAKPLARQMINGDRHRIGEAAASLTNAAERLLAAFAEPGRPFAELGDPRPTDAEFAAILNEPIRYAENEFTESVDLKRITAKIKNDLRIYLSEGGTVGGYLNELVKRQKLEVSYREKAERNLERLVSIAFPRSNAKVASSAKQSAYDYWLKANAQLQSMGIYPLPLPSQLRGFQATLDLDE